MLGLGRPELVLSSPIMEKDHHATSTCSSNNLDEIELRIKHHIGAIGLVEPVDKKDSASKIHHETIDTPLDFNSFQKRVNSFQISTWFNKPYCLNPLVCSRYGFVNYAADKVKCSVCGARLCFKTNFDNIAVSSDVVEKRARDFLQDLKNSHSHQCVFFNQPSPMRFTLFCQQDTSSGMTKNIVKMHCFRFFKLFKLFIKMSQNLDMNLKLDNQFLSTYHKENEKSLEILTKYLKDDRVSWIWLCLFNWELVYKIENKEMNYYLSCEHCQISHYLKKTSHGITQDDLNPACMHKWWCPCVHSNNMCVDFEQIISDMDENGKNFYSKTTTLRQLNEKPGWKQMMTSLLEDTSSSFDSLNTNLTDSEFGVPSLVKSILTNSVSPLFASEVSRREALRKEFDAIYKTPPKSTQYQDMSHQSSFESTQLLVPHEEMIIMEEVPPLVVTEEPPTKVVEDIVTQQLEESSVPEKKMELKLLPERIETIPIEPISFIIPEYVSVTSVESTCEPTVAPFENHMEETKEVPSPSVTLSQEPLPIATTETLTTSKVLPNFEEQPTHSSSPKTEASATSSHSSKTQHTSHTEKTTPPKRYNHQKQRKKPANESTLAASSSQGTPKKSTPSKQSSNSPNPNVTSFTKRKKNQGNQGKNPKKRR